MRFLGYLCLFVLLALAAGCQRSEGIPVAAPETKQLVPAQTHWEYLTVESETVTHHRGDYYTIDGERIHGMDDLLIVLDRQNWEFPPGTVRTNDLLVFRRPAAGRVATAIKKHYVWLKSWGPAPDEPKGFWEMEK
jgi:hypothetical protein